jgi:hypothetical protein
MQLASKLKAQPAPKPMLSGLLEAYLNATEGCDMYWQSKGESTNMAGSSTDATLTTITLNTLMPSHLNSVVTW